MTIFDVQPFILALTLCLGTASQAYPQKPPDGAVQEQPVPARAADLKLPPSLPVLARIGSPGLIYKAEKVRVGEIAFASGGDVIAVSGDFEAVWLWDAVSLKEVDRVILPGLQCDAIAFSRDGRLLALGGTQASVSVYDAHSLKKLWAVKVDAEAVLPDLLGPGMVVTLAFSPDGSMLATGGLGLNQEISIRDPATGRVIRRIEGHDGPIYSLAFAPDGKSIATGSGDKTLRIWDPATGREVRRFAGDGGFLYAVAFSPDGKTVASSGFEAKVCVWDVASGRELSRSSCPHVERGAGIASLTFSPDGKRLLADDDDAVIVFDASAR